MNRIPLVIGAAPGGALGRWLGSFIGIMTAYAASVVFTASGIFIARLIMINCLE